MKKNPIVLFVDDDIAILQSMRRVFRQAPFTVVYACSAEEAAMNLVIRPVRVIVCDYHMHGMNGIEFLENASVNMPNAARILLTGNTSPEIAREAQERCALNRMFLKPVDSNELAAAIHEAMA